MLNWANRFNICCFLDNNQYALPFHRYEALLAVGANHSISCRAGTAFDSLKAFHETHKDWIFGHFAYDLKNELEHLDSNHPDGIDFADLHFFIPEIVCLLKDNAIFIGLSNADEVSARKIFSSIREEKVQPIVSLPKINNLQSPLDENAYLDAVKSLQRHIQMGDCYEVNFCRENYRDNVVLEPLSVFMRLNNISPSPMAAFYKVNQHSLMCSSPERYIQKNGDKLISQPIKGTIKRGATPKEDEDNRAQLFNSSKERSENVMVVDLVRNDLSRVAVEGSVHASELFGLYAFPQVHHMISTVEATLSSKWHWTESIRQSFPMGSMTGAPKLRVMQLIEQHEKSRRGVFSGAVGYCDPEGNFDFNVVIRSILYNRENKYLSFQTGSAITFYSNPAKEWEECLLKAKGMRHVLGLN